MTQTVKELNWPLSWGERKTRPGVGKRFFYNSASVPKGACLAKTANERRPFRRKQRKNSRLLTAFGSGSWQGTAGPAGGQL